MAGREQLAVFCYDISRDKTRNKVADILERFGVRVQFSVFECRMRLDKAQYLLSRLDLFREEGDSIRMYVIPEDARQICETRGGAPIAERSQFFLF